MSEPRNAFAIAARASGASFSTTMKRHHQRFFHERNRGKKECDGRPGREAEEIVRWAQEHRLPYNEDGHVHFPDARGTATGARASKTSKS
jgi:hypothetical protein